MHKLYDCAIIGGGPAGLNAALVLGRARRQTVLFDNGKPRNAVTHASHGFITRDGVTPAEFRRIAYEEVLKYPSVRHHSAEVTSIRPSAAGFEVTDAAGQMIQARKVLLATGLKEHFPEIEGFRSLYGQSLFNCPYCDGWELRDQPLVVVSGTPHLFHLSKLLLTNWSKDLVVCTNGKAALTEEQTTQLKAKGALVIEQPVAAFIGREGRLEQVRFADGTEIARSGGFVSPEFSQSAPFMEQLGCDKTSIGGFVTDGMGRSSVQGVYIAGDASYVGPSQLIAAAADGSRTAAAVNADLTDEDF